MFRLKTVAFVLAAGLFVGACGGDEAGGGGAQAYASSVCQAFSTWVNDIQARNNTLTNALSPQSTPSEQKEQLGVFLDSVIQDTDKLISSVNAASVPDVEGGERAAAQIKGAVARAKSSFQNARQQVGELPTNNQAAFDAGAGQIGTQIRTSLGSLGAELRNRSQSQEIRNAFQESPTCAALRGRTTGGASPGS